MTTVETVWVTGSSGFLGREICRGLAKLPGIGRVVGIDLKPPRDIDETEFFRHDLASPFENPPPEAKIIVHLAFRLDRSPGDGMAGANLQAGRQLLQWCARRPPRHLVWMSSATVYGSGDDGSGDDCRPPFSEDCPLCGEQFSYAKEKVQLERELASFQTAHPEVSVTVLRPSSILGTGTSNPLFLHLGRPLVLLPADACELQLTHVSDLVEIVRRIVHRRIVGIFNVGAEGTFPPAVLTRLLGQRCLTVPGWVFRLGNDLAWHLRLNFLQPVETGALNLLRHPWSVDSSRVQRVTKFTFGFTSRQCAIAFAKHKRTVTRKRNQAGGRISRWLRAGKKQRGESR